MATSQQKDKLIKDLEKCLGLSNIDFSKYNFKVNKATQKVIDLITANLKHVSLKILKDGDSEIGSTLLFSLKLTGTYDTLTKPMIKVIHSISASEWHPTHIDLLVGSHHAGFEGLIIAAEVIRYTSKNGIHLTREVKDCTTAKRIVEKAFIQGTPLTLSQWNYPEKGYIFRQCGISEVNLDAFANYEVEDFKVQAVEECLVVELNGVRSINSSFKLRFIDNEVIGFDLDKCDHKELSAFKAWLVVRGKNVQDLYRNALFEQKRAAIKERLANGNGTMDVIRQMVIVSSQIACGKNLEPMGSFEELDKLAEQYLKLRNAHK